MVSTLCDPDRRMSPLTENHLSRTWIAALVGALALATAGGAAATPIAGLSCSGQSTSHPFTPWLDGLSYVLAPSGSLESTAGWTLSGGAAQVAGNEPFHVNGNADGHSLLLPAGSSATSPSMCVTLLHPTLRFFARSSGSQAGLLVVDAVTTVLGKTVTTPAGVVLGGGTWAPTLPLPFLDNLLSPLSGPVSFRFTPVGAASWQIDDVYVDPFKQG